ncbi:MAG: hypothetical protein WA110_04435 [Anaerolineaceae bacterium]
MKKRWIVVTFIFIITLLILSIPPIQKNDAESKGATILLNKKENEVTKNSFSLVEAKNLILSSVHSDNALFLLSLESKNDPSDTTSSGTNGERCRWTGMVTDDLRSSLATIVEIKSGVVEIISEQPRPDGMGVLEGQILIDSADAFKLASNAKEGFGPADDKNIGINFILSSSSNGFLVVTVVGSIREKSAYVTVDVLTGAILKAQVQSFGSGGILYSDDAGESWQASNVDNLMVSGLARDPLQDNHAYATVIVNDRIELFESSDGGATWISIGKLPESSGSWAYDINCTALGEQRYILVGTSSGLLISVDGIHWKDIDNLPGGTVQWISSIYDAGLTRIVVSIVSGDEPGVYSSHDLVNWEQLDTKPYRFSPSYDGKTILLTHEDLDQGILLFLNKEKNITLPRRTLHAAGDYETSDFLIIEADHSGVRKLVGNEFVSVSLVLSGSIGCSPQFPQDQLVILGGFRTGIYRSTDDGATWTLVLEDPSLIVSGTNEIADLTFLSNRNTVLINLGGMVWMDI